MRPTRRMHALVHDSARVCVCVCVCVCSGYVGVRESSLRARSACLNVCVYVSLEQRAPT